MATNNVINSPIPIPIILGGTGVTSFSTGILKSTTPTGALQTAVAGTDYYSPGNPTTIIDTWNSGAYNFSVGKSNFTTLTTGASNLALGFSALEFIGNGSYNVAIGFQAGSSITTANNNTIIGYQAGYLQNGNGNTILGCNSGSVGGNTNCLYVGYLADASTSGLTNASAIGYNAKVGISNAIVLGSPVSGSVATTVGINTSSPTQANLVVYGGVLQSGLGGEESCIRAIASEGVAAKIELQCTNLHEIRSYNGGTLDFINRTSGVALLTLTPAGDIQNSSTYYGKKSGGTIGMTGNVTATVVTANVWTKVLGTTITSAFLNKFSVTGFNNRLTYTGTNTGFFSVVASLSAAISAGTTLSFSIFKNGTQVSLSTGSAQGLLATTLNITSIASVSLTANDYVEVYCRATNNVTVTVSEMALQVMAT